MRYFVLGSLKLVVSGSGDFLLSTIEE